MMLGFYQSAHLRLEVNASAPTIQDALTCPSQIQHWIQPQHLEIGLPDRLRSGLRYKSELGIITISHEVIALNPEKFSLKLLLSGAVEGFHYWHWGEGWVQSQLEGVSLLPLKLSHTYMMAQLRGFLESI